MTPSSPQIAPVAVAWSPSHGRRRTVAVLVLSARGGSPCLFDRHAVGGEYHAAFKTVGAGTATTTFRPADGSADVVVDRRDLKDATSAVVVYDNP